MISEIVKLKPSEFVEKYMGVELHDWKRLYVDNLYDILPKVSYYLPSRGCTKRLARFVQMYTHLSNMKENDRVVVIRPSGNLELNREEFTSWLSKEFGGVK